MPNLFSKNLKQYKTEPTNKSWLHKKKRLVIESVNGLLIQC